MYNIMVTRFIFYIIIIIMDLLTNFCFPIETAVHLDDRMEW